MDKKTVIEKFCNRTNKQVDQVLMMSEFSDTNNAWNTWVEIAGWVTAREKEDMWTAEELSYMANQVDNLRMVIGKRETEIRVYKDLVKAYEAITW